MPAPSGAELAVVARLRLRGLGGGSPRRSSAPRASRLALAPKTGALPLDVSVKRKSRGGGFFLV
eukprot:scaffold8321_cov138-Isochrysis_galbana.AAC.6